MSGRPSRKASKGPTTPSSGPEGSPKSPSSVTRRSRRQQQLPALDSVAAAEPSADDRSIGTQGSFASEVSISSTGTKRPGLKPYLLSTLLELIESEEWGGIERFKKEPKHGRLLQKLLDSRLPIDSGELFGKTGDKIRTNIGKYVDRWKGHTQDHYVVHVLDRYQVQSLKSKRAALKAKQKAPSVAPSRATLNAAAADVSDLESSDHEEGESFVIREIQTTAKKPAARPAATPQVKPKPKPQPSKPRSPKMASYEDELSPGARAMAKRLGACDFALSLLLMRLLT